MTWYLVKLLITAVLVIAISEISKRSTVAGAVLASIPLVSVLAMVWLYVDTRDSERVGAFATGVFWLVLPSLALFISLPPLLAHGLNFYLALAIASALTVACYFGMLAVLTWIGIRL